MGKHEFYLLYSRLLTDRRIKDVVSYAKRHKIWDTLTLDQSKDLEAMLRVGDKCLYQECKELIETPIKDLLGKEVIIVSVTSDWSAGKLLKEQGIKERYYQVTCDGKRCGCNLFRQELKKIG